MCDFLSPLGFSGCLLADMIKTEAMQVTQQNDAELVAESLNGNQEGFRKIVERYQTLICSLAYCATGSVSQSEDLAQETFVAAWKQLPELREPLKLRSWLCAILRFRISKQFRRQPRDPIHAAESMDAADQRVAPEIPPSDQTISNEEQTILWRSIERIPEMYREPLVLFYREHQSIEAVAQKLELSEDAVKQRLSRGRKMLQDEVAAFVTGALERTNPGQTFTLSVMAVLPAMTFSAKTAMFTAAAKGGAVAVKGTTLGSVLGALPGPALGVFCGYLGWRTNLKSAKTPAERAFMKRYMIMIGVGVLIFTAALLSLNFLMGSHARPHTALLIALGLTFTVGYGLFIFVTAWRFNRGFSALRDQERRLHPEAFANEKIGTVSGTMSLGPICAVPWEYRSRATLFGLPLVHARAGRLPGEKVKPAIGWIAFGEVAYGLVANGGVAVGVISIGGASFGIISFGGFAFGLLAFGGLSVGLIALGGAAIGWVASGGVAVAWHAALGGLAAARELALGGSAMAHHVNDEVAREFFIRYRWMDFTQPGPRNLFWTLCFAPVLLQMVVWRWFQRKLVKRGMQN
jgi:RNA polymerase sigma factor (sigma-70 family)